MAIGNLKPLDQQPNQGGLPYRIPIPSPSKVRHHQSPFRAANPTPKRSRRSYSVGGSTASPNKRAGARSLFPSVSCTKTQWEIQNDNKSETPKQVYSLPKIQDGDHKFSCKINPKKCSDGDHRFKRRLLPYTNSSVIPEVPEICSSSPSGNSALPIHMSPIRDFLSTPHLHEGDDRSNFPSKAQTHNYHSILGRHVDSGEFESSTQFGYSVHGPPSTVPRVDYKLGEVESNLQYPKNIPGGPSRLGQSNVLSACTQTYISAEPSPGISKDQILLDKVSYVSIRSPNILYPSSSVGPIPYKDSTEPSSVSVGREKHFPRKENPLKSRYQDLLKVVAPTRKSQQGSTLGPGSGISGYHRRQQIRLGCPLRPVSLPGEVVSGAQSPLLKLQGTVCDTRGAITYTAPIKRSPCTDTLRQYHSGRPHTSSGDFKTGASSESGKRNIFLGRTIHPIHFCHTPEGFRKPESRLLKSSDPGPRGMVAIPGGFSPYNSEMGDTTSRSIRNKEKSQGGEVFLPQPQGSSISSRCPKSVMELQASVRLPSNTSNPQGSSKITKGKLHPDSDRPLLAQKELVRPAEAIELPGPSTSSGGPRFTNTRSHLLQGLQESPLVGLDIERTLLLKKGLSEKVIKTLLLSRKPSTQKIYLKVWKKFQVWCGESRFSLEQPNISLILDFLQDGLDLGLSPNTLRVQVSALSALYDTSLSQVTWVSRFLNAADRLRPRIKNLCPPWNLNWVLNALTAAPFEPLAEIPIRLLTLKTIFLVAITSARRVSELQALSIQDPFLVVQEDKLVFRLDPSFLPKVVSQFHRSQDIIVPSFCANPKNSLEQKFHNLDVRRAVLQYIQATQPWRVDKNLFIQFFGKNRGKKAAKSSISRWIRSAICEAYTAVSKVAPEGLKAHSTRALSTSWAQKASASLEQICKAATWKNVHTFSRHYRLDVMANQDMAFGRKVLSAVVPP